MNITARTTLASALTLLATAALSPVSATSLPPASINPVFNASLIRCVDSHFSKSLGICGGDALASGHIALTPKATLIKTEGALADPFNLYEVYWLALGDTLADAVPAGQFVTDCQGNGRGALTNITTAAEALDAVTGTPVVIYPSAGYLSAGVFLIYSRGPWAYDNDGDCVADTYNTVVNQADTDASHALANPPVTPGIDNVQFLSGYRLTASAPGSEGSEISPETVAQESLGQPGQGNGQQPPMNTVSGYVGQPGQGNGQQPPMNTVSGYVGQPGQGNGQQPPMNTVSGYVGQPGQGNGQRPPMNTMSGYVGQPGQGNGQFPVAPVSENPAMQQPPVLEGTQPTQTTAPAETANRQSARRGRGSAADR